ncbi:MAG TPA: flavodoxin [Ruminococcaceae bacterium]|nr:flavodoxin [Oscillospiraceae bacterium]
MKAAVRYFTKTGHTKLLADAIAEAAGVTAETIDKPLEEDVDILFLGSAVYATKLDDEVKNFIDGISVNVGKVVPFSSAAILSGTYKQVKAECEAKGLKVSDEEFFCKGAFGIIAKGRPNSKDAENAAAFAKKFL